jgi:SAM-dependent methyltransferase
MVAAKAGQTAEYETMSSTTSLDSARAYWDIAATSYGKDFTETLIGQTRRYAVWRDLGRLFYRGQRILELNCGTGLDAVHLASKGIHVLGCDLSPGMIELARQLVIRTNLSDRIDLRVLPTEDIRKLARDAPFDGAFSNFSGLNCVEDLSSVARDLANLLKPGAPFLAVMIGRFVPWEMVWFLAHGHLAKALHRLQKGQGTPQGGPVSIRRPSVEQIARIFGPWFELRRWKGIGIAVPPSYMEHWACRFPRATTTLAAFDARVGSVSPFRNMADQVILEFQANEQTAA